MLAVVDSCQDNLLIAKIVLRDAADLDERNYNLYNMLSQGSQWQIVRVLSLENFNKTYIGVLGIENCPLKETILDLTQFSVSEDRFPESLTLQKDADKAAGFKLSKGQNFVLKECHAQTGLIAVRGDYNSGKTGMIAPLVASLLNLQQLMKKQKVDNIANKKVKKYSIAELMAGGDSSDDEMYSGTCSKKTMYPW